jgi:ribulose-5-phosphate 4-epimerase/fuculose-1-phosphate aldolase
VHAVTATDVDAEPTRNGDDAVDHGAAEVAARTDLAALFRACVLHDFHEGIDNHCSLAIPGRPGRFLLNPFGPHWSELRASDLLEVDADGTVIGDGVAETTAFALHAAVHRARPDANCVVHTHVPYATALAATEQGLDTLLSQNAAKFHGGRYAYYRDYGARFGSPDECAPIVELAAAGVRVVLLRNHGVLVIGETVARAWWDLYFLERAAMVQVLAGASGQRLAPMPDDVGHRAAEQFEDERDEAPATWAAVRRRLDRELPGYQA